MRMKFYKSPFHATAYTDAEAEELMANADMLIAIRAWHDAIAHGRDNPRYYNFLVNKYKQQNEK